MDGTQLLKERVTRGLEQQDAAVKLQVSQPYLSLIEAGKRPVTEKLARRAIRIFNLSLTALPVKYLQKTFRSENGDYLAGQLANLGYPKFSHLKVKKSRPVNPAAVLIYALQTNELESRSVEALPWLIFNFPEMGWTEIFSAAKLADAQNRLGFLLSLAHRLAVKIKDKNKQVLFKELLLSLKKSRLALNDSFRREALTETEKSWLRKNRPQDARDWRVLSNLSAEHLIF